MLLSHLVGPSLMVGRNAGLCLTAATVRSGDEPAPPERAQPIAMSSDMPGRSAFEAIARSCLRQIKANEACAQLGRDAEGVHQFRVGLRRLRTLLGAFRKLLAPDLCEYLEEHLDWLQAESGAARDWDVLIAGALKTLRALQPDDPVLPAMLNAARAERDESYDRLRAAFRDPRYAELLLRLELALAEGTWSASTDDGDDRLSRPLPEVASGILNKHYKRFCGIHGKHGDLPEEEMHRLRISGKKLRYIAEFFSGLYPKQSTKRFIDALSDVQDCLGSLNDSLVGRNLAQVLERRLASSTEQGTARHASGLLLGWQAARGTSAVAEFPGAWRKFRSRPPPWFEERR
jgi:CHAD domain-containing protein